MSSRRSGFTLIELLVVIVIIGILVAIALPNFIKVREKAKEAEVKQNLHAVQLAIERYATDNAYGNYPPYILGGDWTDSCVINEEYYIYAQLDQLEVPPWKYGGATAPPFAPQGNGDYLVMEGYMASYPSNPFIKRGNLQPRLLVHDVHWRTNGDDTFFRRTIGGDDNTKMVEIWGPPPVSVFGVIGMAGDLYVIPPYPDLVTPEGLWETRWDKDPNPDEFKAIGSRLLVGNFSYFTRLTSMCWVIYNSPHEVAGYTLAGYGTLKNLGQDVYDRMGEYFPRQRCADCASANFFGELDVLPCQTDAEAGMPNTRSISRGGPDTQPDGVIIVLDSGVDKKGMNPSDEVG